MSREIVYIADDFGMSEEANEAILHAHLEGVLDGTGLMMGQPGTEQAVALARQHPTLQIGWHLHLNDSVPLTLEAWPWGSTPLETGKAVGLSARMAELARREIEAQWAAFRATGLPCRFVNAHHHLHILSVIRRMFVATIGAGFEGWMRWGRPRYFTRGAEQRGHRLLHNVLDVFVQSWPRRRLPYRLSTTLWGTDRTFNMDAREVAAVLPTLGPGLHEFIFHPRRRDVPDPDTRCLLELKELVAAPATAHRESVGMSV